LSLLIHYISRVLLVLFFISLPFLYSEDPSQVNQLHSSSISFDIDETLSHHTIHPLKASMQAEDNHLKSGQPFWVSINLVLDDDWHVYWKNPGDTGMPVSVEWDLPPGFKVDALEWPYPLQFSIDSFIGFGYEKDVHLLARITPPDHLLSGQSFPFKATVKYLACSDSACLPGEDVIHTSMVSSEGEPRANPSTQALFKKARESLPKTTWNFKVQRLHDLIELGFQAPQPHPGKLVKAVFFPDNGQSIDYHVDAVISSEENEGGSYSLALKETDSLDPKGFLRGVLVITTELGGKNHTEALEVSSPIIDGMGDREHVLVANDPANRSIKLNLPALESETEGFDGGLGMALVLAFVGGMILNLMPCVLPVVSFKILSFVKMAGQSRKLTLQHGLFFSAGVMVSFWVLAGALLILQAYGHAVGWGFQLQEPIFVGVLAAILLIFSLSMFGVFEMGIKVGSYAGQLQHQGAKEGFTGSFMSGVLATLIATPCTGPFLGTAVGFAMTLPYYLSLLIFTSLGAGMAFPYMLLSINPRLIKFLPKPGAWMDTFKQLMGFLMLASVLWLVWVFGAQTDSMALVILLAAFFILSLACWIYGRWGTPLHSKKSRLISMGLASMLVLASFYTLTLAAPHQHSADSSTTHVAHNESDWETFSPERLAELKAQGIPVFIDFTAKWCLICQANHMILTASDVHAKFKELGVVRMKADWTKKDTLITDELRKFGRNSVPLYVLYNGEDKPTILPQVLTPGVVLDHLQAVE